MQDTAPSWRSLLPDADGVAPERIPLALGVELRQRASREEAHWGPRRIDAVTARALAARQDDLLVGVRPLQRGASGAWVKGDASWDAVRRGAERYDTAQARWFAELYGIAHDARATGAFASVAEWLVLDHVASGLLWGHLANAERLGIPLVPTHRQQSVTLAAAAEVTVDLTAARGGGLLLTAQVTIDGEARDAACVRPVGRTGVYAFAEGRDPIPLVLAPAPLSDAAAGLLGLPAGLPVPPDEAPDFVRDGYPRLARTSRVRASPGLALPDLGAPTVRITAAFSDHRVAYRLEWTYPGLRPRPYDTPPPGEADRDAERSVAAAVERTWRASTDRTLASAAVLTGDDADDFAAAVLPALERLEGVRVETTGARPVIRELVGDPAISVTTVQSTDPDWFDLGILVTIDGRRIPFGPLLKALSRGRARMRLADGAFFSLAHPALARLRELLEEAASLDEWETGLRLSRYQAALWAEFEDLADESAPALAWRETVRGLREVESIQPPPQPAGLRAELRPYQRTGFSWLTFLWRHGLGGILADDMGLGKTVQTLAFLAHAREEAPGPAFLVVAPTSVLSAWQEQSAAFTPGLTVRTIEATRATSGRSAAEIATGADIVLTSYAVLRLDEEEFAGVEWAGVVLDEAQFVKNPATRVHRAAARLRARTTIAITGTPLENGLGDLWALLSLTAPGLFPSARRFRDEYVQPIEKGRVPDNAEGGGFRAARLERLRRRIRPLVLRRTKELVAADLPPKQEQDLHVELSPAHRELYDTVLHRERQKVLGLLEDLDRNRFIVFRSLTLLRMMSIAPVLVDERHAAIGSAKLDALLDHLQELAREGHRALVFSQFTSFLDLVQTRLDATGLGHARLDGSTARRGDVIDGFRTGDAPVFLISLKAGGFGVTVTEADYVFLLDPWWSPAAEAQAIDRAHRIGQTRSVFVYRLIAAHTIEEKVRDLQRRKSRLFSAVMDDDDLFAQALTADDVRGLLAE